MHVYNPPSPIFLLQSQHLRELQMFLSICQIFCLLVLHKLVKNLPRDLLQREVRLRVCMNLFGIRAGNLDVHPQLQPFEFRRDLMCLWSINQAFFPQLGIPLFTRLSYIGSAHIGTFLEKDKAVTTRKQRKILLKKVVVFCLLDNSPSPLLLLQRQEMLKRKKRHTCKIQGDGRRQGLF